jgi:hypothetical protein
MKAAISLTMLIGALLVTVGEAHADDGARRRLPN